MYKVNKEDFIRLPAGTLYSRVRASDNFCPELMIKTDTGEEYEDRYTHKKEWSFLGAMPLGPDISTSEHGIIEKFLDDYDYHEYIKPSFEIFDESQADIYKDDEFIIYDKEEIKYMIELLTHCIKNKDVDFNVPVFMNNRKRRNDPVVDYIISGLTLDDMMKYDLKPEYRTDEAEALTELEKKITEEENKNKESAK